MYDETISDLALFTDCIACGEETGAATGLIWINIETNSPLRPDGTNVEPGEEGAALKHICNICIDLIQSAINTPMPLQELFPRARIDRFRPGSTVENRTTPSAHTPKLRPAAPTMPT